MLFKESFIEKIFANDDMQSIPIGAQSTAVHAIENILNEIREENPDATIYELFESDSHAGNEQPGGAFAETGSEFTEPTGADTSSVSADGFSTADACHTTESDGAAERYRSDDLYR